MANGQSRIVPESARKKIIDFTGGSTAFFYPDGTFNGQRFNVFQIYNDGSAPLYVGTDPAIGSAGELSLATVVAGGASVIVIIGGADTLYMRSAVTGSSRVYYYFEENVDSNKLYQNLATVIVNSTTTSSVTLAAPIPAGNNNIGDVDIASMPAITGSVSLAASLPAGTNNIGDVDVLSIVPGTGATNLGKAEDAVHASGDTGVMPLAVRKDTAAALAGTDGDYAPLEVDALGRLHTQPNISSVTPGTGATNLGKAEDAAHTSGDVGVMPLAVRQDTLAALDSATGDYTPFKVDALGRQYVTVVSTSGTPTNAIVAMAAADTEYSYSIPAGTRRVEFTMRRATKTPANAGDIVRFSFSSGQVAAGTGNVKTITGDKEYYITDHLFIAATTIYFAGSVAGATMEIVAYS